MKILTIGGTGMLGSAIMMTETIHELWGTYLRVKPKSTKILKLDITDQVWINKLIQINNPDVIIHTAALTNVDFCEINPHLANELHVNGTRYLVQAAKEIGAYFLYISTDSVFDGKKGNYKEEDIAKPLNIYAQTKYEGELEVLKYQNSCIIRTNIYGFNWLPKQSIAEWILSTLRKEENITLFKDVYFSPILVNNLVDVLLEITELRLTGVFHVAGPEGISKLEFGEIIAKIYNLNQELIKPISIGELNLKAPRPSNSTLNCSKIQTKINTKLLNIEDGLNYFKELESKGYIHKLKNL